LTQLFLLTSHLYHHSLWLLWFFCRSAKLQQSSEKVLVRRGSVMTVVQMRRSAVMMVVLAWPILLTQAQDLVGSGTSLMNRDVLQVGYQRSSYKIHRNRMSRIERLTDGPSAMQMLGALTLMSRPPVSLLYRQIGSQASHAEMISNLGRLL
jgi:hypothetical protein